MLWWGLLCYGFEPVTAARRPGWRQRQEQLTVYQRGDSEQGTYTFTRSVAGLPWPRLVLLSLFPTIAFP